MQYFSDDYHCIRCRNAYKWEHLKSTPEGNLFCQTCWKTMDVKGEAKRKCPVDDTVMDKQMIHGLIVIDKCSQCGGTWFDKDELKIIQQEAEVKGWAAGFAFGSFF